MTHSISVRAGGSVLSALFSMALAACGSSGGIGTFGSRADSGNAGAGGSIVANGGDASSGAAGGSSGDASATGGCSSAPVTFQVMPAPSAVTHWCLGQPDSCSGITFDIRDNSGVLNVGSVWCGLSCDTCTFEPCPPLACLMATALSDQGTIEVWRGTYVTSSTCGASAKSCDLTNCAAPGQYIVDVCGFPNPDPSSPIGCTQASSTTSQTCVAATFEYPATAPIVVTMPVE